jgi:hypothetical protein
MTPLTIDSSGVSRNVKRIIFKHRLIYSKYNTEHYKEKYDNDNIINLTKMQK